MPFARIRHALGLVLAFAAAVPASAQSLQELYDAARHYDAAYLSARAEYESAQYRVEQVKALRRPQVGLQVNATRSSSDTPYASTLNADSTQVGAGVNATQSLFNRANDATIAQAEKSLDVARADFEAAEQDLIVRLSQAYFDVLAAQDALATTRTSKAAISEQLASAKRNFEVGTATITDTREAQARFDLASAQEIAAENDLRTKRIALDQLVGRAGVAPKGLSTPVVLPRVEPVDVETWVMQADSSHPLVRKARLGLEVAQLETEKARAGHLPTVALSAGYNKTRISQSGDATSNALVSVNPITYATSVRPFDQSGTSTGASIGITVNVPLFAGYAIQNRVKETLTLEEKSRNDLEAARRGVAQGTRQAFYGVQSLEAQVKALEAAEASSQLALEATQLGYRVGVRVNLDVLNAQTQLYTTQQQLAKARYDVLMGNLRLRQAAGQLTPADVAAINSLLAR